MNHARRVQFGAGPEWLEDRCLLTTLITDAVALGQFSSTPVTETGMIKNNINGVGPGDLYSFTVAQGQTVQVTLKVPGQTSPIDPSDDPFRLGLYDLLPFKPTSDSPNPGSGVEGFASDPAPLTLACRPRSRATTCASSSTRSTARART